MRFELNFDVDYIFIDMQLIPLLAFLSVTYVAAKYSSRMIGGDRVREEEFTFVISVRLWEENVHLCSGALIVKRAVLTASSCLLNYKASLIKAEASRLRLEGHVATRHDVREIIHRRDIHHHKTRNDMAILILTKDVIEGMYVKSIKMATKYDYDEGAGGAQTITFGWGRTGVSILLLPRYSFDKIFG